MKLCAFGDWWKQWRDARGGEFPKIIADADRYVEDVKLFQENAEDASDSPLRDLLEDVAYKTTVARKAGNQELARRGERALSYLVKCANLIAGGLSPDAIAQSVWDLDGAVDAARFHQHTSKHPRIYANELIRMEDRATTARGNRAAKAGRKDKSGRKVGSTDVEIRASFDASFDRTHTKGRERDKAWHYAKAIEIGRLRKSNNEPMTADAVRIRLAKLKSSTPK